MSSIIRINKEQKSRKRVHCSKNKTIIEGSLFCPRCRTITKQRVKKWDNCKSLYYHLTHNHQDEGATSKPTLEESISWLQVISDAVSLRWIQ